MDDVVKAVETAAETLTPAFLKELVHIEGPTLLRVRGMVKDARPWSKEGIAPKCYGRLELDGQILSFCLTSAPFPTEGERVVIKGSLHLNGKSALEIRGELDGSWQPVERPVQPPLPDRIQPPMTLMQFLADHKVTDLGFLATNKAWGDICSSSGVPEIRQCPRSPANFTDEVEFVEAIAAMAQKGVAGIVVARGGGEELSTIGSSALVANALIESGLPFYAAIGHSDDVVLLDKHADQCFATPSDLSHQISGFVRTRRKFAANASSAKEANEKLKQAETAVAESKRTIKQIEAQRDDLSRQLQAGNPQMAKIAETQRKDARSHRKLYLATAAALALLIVGADVGVIHRLLPHDPSLALDPAQSNSAVEMPGQNATDANCSKAANDKGTRSTQRVKNDPCGRPAPGTSASRSHHGHSARGTDVQKSPDT